MTQVEIQLNLARFNNSPKEQATLSEALECRKAAEEFIAEERYLDAMERTVAALRAMREFPDYSDPEFRALLVALLFDLAEIHFALKNFKQSEKELDTLFKVLDNLVKLDEDRFGKFHILAMELSTRILRSRKKAMDLLVKQQMNAGALYEKVNAGVVAATDKLVDSLRNVGELLASTGDLKAALKFYAEAIKYSKKRTGRVTRKEVQMTIEMAEIMMRIKQMRPRARRLLQAILPHAISLETIELEQNIIALTEVIDAEQENDSKWKNFLYKVTSSAKAKLKKTEKMALDKAGDIVVKAGELVNKAGEMVENAKESIGKEADEKDTTDKE